MSVLRRHTVVAFACVVLSGCDRTTHVTNIYPAGPTEIRYVEVPAAVPTPAPPVVPTPDPPKPNNPPNDSNDREDRGSSVQPAPPAGDPPASGCKAGKGKGEGNGTPGNGKGQGDEKGCR
jgi:hypothetical protein